MKIAFLFFARSRELAGTDTCKIDLPDGMQNLNIHMTMSKFFSSLLDLLDTFRHQGTSSYCALQDLACGESGASTQDALQAVLKKYPSLAEIEGTAP